MFKFQKLSLFLLVIAGSVLLTGCLDRQTPAEKIFAELENVVALEEEFEQQQDPLVQLEKREQEIYEEILALGLKEYDQITKLSDEALDGVAQRKEHMEKEQESLKASETEFQKVDEHIQNIEDADLKEQATELFDIMNERYAIHDELYESYQSGLEHDKVLYEMFKDEELTLEQLEDQINKVNEAYSKVLDANERFNQQTDKYNQSKLEFYEAAGLNAQTTEE
ncbi:YkyA family protein [Mesobacillus harenae]|uniref:YkyA family protein n=1 Tax=Mesobacillus harenae TaxID=2213203 RepID=UPI001580556A|nr:YkyA family protein [Mesobacillus harenae]